eukprot:UN01198
MNGNVAYQYWSSSSTQAIQNGSLRHHLVIDYWFTWLASSLEISNIRLYGSGAFHSGCGVALEEIPDEDTIDI